MKTPEEIKKGLERRKQGYAEQCGYDCSKCDVYVPGYLIGDLLNDALAYIRQLEEKVALYDECVADAAKLQKERDAAVQCIPRACGYCKHVIDYGLSNTPGCKNPECRNISGINTGWEWRGVQEVE